MQFFSFPLEIWISKVQKHSMCAVIMGSIIIIIITINISIMINMKSSRNIK